MHKIVGVNSLHIRVLRSISVHARTFCQSGNEANSESFQANSQTLQDNVEVGGIGVTQNPEAGCFEDNGQFLYKEICSSIVAKLQGSGMANSLVSTIVSDLEELATGLHSQVKHEVLSIVSADDPVRSRLEDSLENFENPFDSFNTESKRTKYFSEKWGVVEPVELMLGV